MDMKLSKNISIEIKALGDCCVEFKIIQDDKEVFNCELNSQNGHQLKEYLENKLINAEWFSKRIGKCIYCKSETRGIVRGEPYRYECGDCNYINTR